MKEPPSSLVIKLTMEKLWSPELTGVLITKIRVILAMDVLSQYTNVTDISRISDNS